MIYNEVIEAVMKRKSIRKFHKKMVPDDVVETVVRAGQQAPFAMQLGSLVLSRDVKKNPFKAPLLFTVCVDINRMEKVMEARGWKRKASDLYALIFGMQDAAYMAENMVIAAESLDLGSCYIGAAPFMAEKLVERYDLPKKVFPLVMLAMGYPAEDPPPRPRYPLSFHLFEDSYPELSAEETEEAMLVMDTGYLKQEYYRRAGYMVPLPEGMDEEYDYDTYSWTEHISRKLGLWGGNPDELLKQLRACGFSICGGEGDTRE